MVPGDISGHGLIAAQTIFFMLPQHKSGKDALLQGRASPRSTKAAVSVQWQECWYSASFNVMWTQCCVCLRAEPKTVQTFCAGPVRKVVFVALRTSIDALEATEQVATPDLERLHDTLYALESLTYFQRNIAEVSLSLQLRDMAAPKCLIPLEHS